MQQSTKWVHGPLHASPSCSLLCPLFGMPNCCALGFSWRNTFSSRKSTPPHSNWRARDNSIGIAQGLSKSCTVAQPPCVADQSIIIFTCAASATLGHRFCRPTAHAHHASESRDAARRRRWKLLDEPRGPFKGGGAREVGSRSSTAPTATARRRSAVHAAILVHRQDH